MEYVFGAFLTIATADGLIGLRDTASVAPPSGNETWEELLQGGSYTLLPPELVNSVPCNPPVNNWEVFVGGFAAIAGIGAAGMLAALASIPLVLLTGFFYILYGVVLLGEVVVFAVGQIDWEETIRRRRSYFWDPPRRRSFDWDPPRRRSFDSDPFRRRNFDWDPPRRRSYDWDRRRSFDWDPPRRRSYDWDRRRSFGSWNLKAATVENVTVNETVSGPDRWLSKKIASLGSLASNTIPSLFLNTFASVSSSIYNTLVPQKTLKPCPRGLLFLPGSAPVCVSDMAKLEAKRYTCPEDASRSVVLSCEPEFNGVTALRGNPC